MTASFSERNVVVCMSGAEWTVLMAKLVGRDLSVEGARIYNRACSKLTKQVTEASR